MKGRRADFPTEILFFGGYEPEYPRNAIIRKGLERQGVKVTSCRVDGTKRALFRYPLLLARYMRTGKMKGSPLFVPDFRHKDVPLAWMLSRLPRRKIIFDPLVSRYETRVLDRRDAARGSAQARHNWNIDRISMRMADILLADTNAHARFYANEFGIDPGKIRTLYLGYDDTVFSCHSPRIQDEEFRVLFYGSFLPLHGTDTIVKAAGMLDGRFHFLIVGGGQTMGDFRDRLKRMKGAAIELIGSVPQADLPGLIAGSDVVLGVFGTTPKTGMVIPNKVYQAMASNRPVITADTPAIRELFEPGRHLLTVPPGDAGSLAEALKQIRDDRQLSLSVADAGGRLVRERYDPSGVAGRFMEILEQEGIV